MSILSGFFSEDLAIDLGTVNTIVYAPMQGVVLNEPSVVALHKYSGEVLSVGSQALKLLGREPNDTEVHRPIRRGAIDNFEISQKFLRALISRVQHNDHPRRSHLVIGVPGSATPLERRSVKDAARDAKAGRVDLVDEGLAAGLGAGLDFENEQADLVIDIGGKELANGGALAITINAREVSGELEPVLAEIISAVRRVIEDAKPEVTADLYYSGVTLTGGGALLGGMTERFENDLNLKVTVPEDPLTTVVLGAGRLLGEPEKLQRAALRLDVPAWEDAEKLVVNW